MVTLKIWNKEVIPPGEYSNPKPSYEIEIGYGDVLSFEDDEGNSLFYIEVGSLMNKINTSE